jgi:molecular chaperone DnaJ
VNVEVPRNVNGKAREALEAFREATAGPDPRDELLRKAKAD